MTDVGIDPAALGRAIWRRREARGWARNRLATRAGVAPPYLGRIERGDANVGLELLVRLAHALGVTVDDLLADAGMPTVRTAGMPESVASAYAALTPPFRRAYVQMGRVLLEAQAEYVAGLTGEETDEDFTPTPGQPVAASHDPAGNVIRTPADVPEADYDEPET